MQKPIVWLSLAIFVCLSTSFSFSERETHLKHFNEGIHPKNENLAIVCNPQDSIFVNVLPNTCIGEVKIPLPVSDDDVICPLISASYSIDGMPPVILSLPLPDTIVLQLESDTFSLVWSIVDGCFSTVINCSVIIVVIDNEPPLFSCTGKKVVSLSQNAVIQAEEFVEPTAMDVCGGPVIIEVRRFEIACGILDSDEFGPEVEFCCADAVDSVMVQVKLSDIHGNANTCMVWVEVQENQKPEILYPLPDITISCEYPLDLNNLDAFGKLVHKDSTSAREDIIIIDHYYPDGYVGQDGVYFDNCPNVVISSSVRNLLTMCRTGEIKRDFLLQDMAGNDTIFTQTIYVMDAHKFELSDIQWPEQTVYTNECSTLVPPPAETGEPLFIVGYCNQIAATFKDHSFAHPVYCRYIQRTWTVIDWCQYKTNTPNSPGKWVFIQDIFVVNDVAPVIQLSSCQDTTIFAKGGDCFANILFSAIGTDDCVPESITWSYTVDINNDGINNLAGNGPILNSNFARGKHRMTWFAKDQCGNTGSCTFFFTVKESKAPTPIALYGLVANITLSDSAVTIWASDFNNHSNDNCTSAPNLKYSFSADIDDTSRTFNCAHLGRQDIELWVTDEDGNQSVAYTYIIVQDNHDLCGISPRISIKGAIKTEDNLMLPGTVVFIDGGETEGNKMTDNEGVFSFEELAMYNNYELAPIRDTLPGQGISTLDLVIIQRHILGIQPITSPYKIIAADVNNSQSVTAADLVELRKLILGINDRFTNNTSWRFVDSGQSFTDKSHPWPLIEKINYESLDENMTNSDFIAIKTGDVNGSASENFSDNQLQNRSAEKLNLYTEDNYVKAGDMVSIPIRISDRKHLVGLQWTFEISVDLEYQGFEAVDLPMKSENIAYIQKNGKRYITASYHHPDGIQLGEDAILINLIFDVKRATRFSKSFFLNNDITYSEAYNHDDKPIDMSLGFKMPKGAEKNVVMQNQPNPFREETGINLLLDKKSNVSITIFDGEGKLVFKNTEEMPAGNNQLVISDKQLGGRLGVFYCKIKAAELNDVIKILRIE